MTSTNLNPSRRNSARFCGKFCTIPLLVLAAAIILLLCCSAGFSQAENAPLHSFRIAHITDMHVFTEEACNEYSPAYDKAENDYFYILKQSRSVLDAVLDKIKTENADYLIVSGDMASNGEKSSHLLVADALRSAQTYMRQNGKPDFQIFVIPGNHDLYDDRAVSYMPSEAELAACKNDAERENLVQNYRSRQVESITPAEFFEIYKDLGYGGSTKGDVRYFYQSEHFYGGAGTDYTVALASYNPSEKQLEEAKENPDALDEPSRAGGLSYAVQMPDGFTVIALDSNRFEYVGANAYASLGAAGTRFGGWGYKTGGDVNERQLRWMTEVIGDWQANATALVATCHHSVVPHFDAEDDILTGFMVDDFRTLAYVLADNGVHYVFTGHVHSNDIANYCSQQGNVLYDIETPSTCAYGAGYRIMDLQVFADGKEKLYDNVYSVDEVNGTDLVAVLDSKSSSVTTLLSFYVNADLIAKLKDKASGIGGKSLLGGTFTIGGVTADLICQLIDDLASLDLVKPAVNGAKYTFNGKVTKGYHLLDFANDFIQYFFSVDATCGRWQGGYPIADMAMDMYRTNLIGAEERQLSEKLQAVSDAFTSGDFAEMLVNTLVDWLMPQLNVIFDAPLNLTATPLEKGAGFDLSAFNTRYKSVPGSDLGKKLFNMLKEGEVDSLRTLVMYLNTLAESFSSLLATLGDTVNKVLEYAAKIEYDTDLYTFVKTELLDKYATHAFFVNLGYYADDIIKSFALDASSEGGVLTRAGEVLRYTYPTQRLIKYTAADGTALNDEYTYFGKLSDAQNPATTEDGRLPSMLSVAYGKDGYSQVNFKWFTAIQRTPDTLAVPVSYFRYWAEGRNYLTDAPTEYFVAGTNEDVWLNLPLIDLGVIYLTSTTVRYEMHTASITNFESGKTYHYQVGSDEYGWSPVYSITMKAKNGTVDALAFADIQGSVQQNYILSKEYMALALETVGGIDFAISAGDNVDKDDNTYHWQWLLNHNRDLFANYVFVTTAGNHENGGNALEQYLALPSAAKVTGEKGDTNGYYYSFDRESVHFTVLNTNDLAPTGKLGNAQTTWLKADLKAAKDKWIVVVMHKGLYTAGSHAFDSDVAALRAQLTPLFAEYGVDLVLQGHDHCYSVSEYIASDGTVAEVTYDDLGAAISPEGVLYVNLGTLGDKFYDYLYHEDVTLLRRKASGYIDATPLGGYLSADGKLELTGAPAFAKLHADDKLLMLTTYAIAEGKAYMLDNIRITSSEGAITLDDAPKFSVKVVYDYAVHNLNQSSDVFQNAPVRQFYVTENGKTTYYTGYCLADCIDNRSVCHNGKYYATSGCYVALYSAEQPDGEYAPLSEGKFFALAAFDGAHELPLWLFALLIGMGALVVCALVTVWLLKRRANKLRNNMPAD